jgi:hypothetical protein
LPSFEEGDGSNTLKAYSTSKHTLKKEQAPRSTAVHKLKEPRFPAEETTTYATHARPAMHLCSRGKQRYLQKPRHPAFQHAGGKD